ncbi:MAG: hypothetical protein LBB15_00680, partial [Puniceicoccales bacterium]|nr:hypothetical protein [Puniceicoccales bacterium]
PYPRIEPINNTQRGLDWLVDALMANAKNIHIDMRSNHLYTNFTNFDTATDDRLGSAIEVRRNIRAIS